MLYRLHILLALAAVNTVIRCKGAFVLRNVTSNRRPRVHRQLRGQLGRFEGPDGVELTSSLGLSGCEA